MMTTRALIDWTNHRRSTAVGTGLEGSERAYLLSRICNERTVPVVVILPSATEAQRFYDNLGFFSDGLRRRILTYPSYNILPQQKLAYHSETAAQRISVLYQLLDSNPPPIVVTSTEAVMKRVVPKRALSDYAEPVMVNEEMVRPALVEKLEAGGYTHCAIVEERGDFSVRGGIMDVFPPLYTDPLRIEFFGDTVETIRFFDVGSQRRKGHLDEAVLLPARESIVDPERIDSIVARLRMQAAALDHPAAKTRRLIRQIRDERTFPGVESLLPIVYSELDTFFDYLTEDTLFVCIEPGELQKASTEFERQLQENFVSARERSHFCIDPAALHMDWDAVKARIEPNNPLVVKTLAVSEPLRGAADGDAGFHFSVTDNSEIAARLKHCREGDGRLSPLVEWIGKQRHSGIQTWIACKTRSQVRRIRSLLSGYRIEPEMVEGFLKVKPGRRGVFICTGDIDAGFVWPAEGLALITSSEIFGVAAKGAKRSEYRPAAAQIAFSDLKHGDFVVHDEHGIGRYEGLVKLSVNGSTNDFLRIQYKDQDKLYLPVDRMAMIQKYMGTEGAVPVLNKMGGKSWERVKRRVKRSAEKIAGELLKLYASRQVESGHAFDRSDPDLKDFESGFPYDETADQIKAISDVFQDMEKPFPMDRLVCGDVGYGKTEVALRAAFKAVNDCKQVAVLVPTTVLAEQHFRTFSQRFENYPVQSACLTRFRSASEQREIVMALQAGTIDIVIGTHRLLQRDVDFKDLGLLIFDEEHRFGVKHKERLKSLKRNVDVLTLTATPIPRTLHLSLTGIRDISTISTPPEHRRSIVTYISELDDTVISEAIRYELSRGGQIFFIHNAIHTIEKMARHLKTLVPEVRLAVAHGRMEEDQLERVMIQFMNRDIDLLVCTTIVESGLDVPSANAILINRADRLGLSQMYQLRGRVGRADEQAFAYLFIPPESHLSKEAQKRLKVLMAHSDLGSGFQIAMNDLKIRGGGTILGASQSGHIAAVGYDMFLRLMEQAVSELKGRPVTQPLEPEINIRISAFFPESFIPDIDQRLAAYRRMAKMTQLSEISEYKAELEDRYGRLPNEAVNLLRKIMLRVLSVKAGIKRMDIEGRHLMLYFSTGHLKNPEKLSRFATDEKGYRRGRDPFLKMELSEDSAGRPLAAVKNILKEIARHANT